MSLDSVMQHLERFGWAVFASRDLEPEKLIGNLGMVIMENDVSIDRQSRSLVRSNKALPPHTDHHLVEHILWYCHQQDDEGGESILVDGVKIFLKQNDHDKTILKSISLMEHCVFEGDLTHHPMVVEDENGLSLYYSFWMAEGLSKIQKKVFDKFTKSVMETKPIKFKLEQDNCLIIDNRRIFHGRTALSENSDRFLKRYWISSSIHNKLDR